jgi:ATP-dependent Clp protease protease subunit
MIINAKQQGKTVVLTNLVNEGSTFELYDSIVSERYYEDMPGVECKDVTNFLNEASGDITLRINSKGGDVGPSLAIFNRLRAYDRGDVTTIVDGYAWSCAGWIAMAGKKRIINTGCLFMMHNPILSATITNAADIDKVRTKWESAQKSIVDIFANTTGLSEDDVKNRLEAETFYSAAEAVEQGFFTELGSSPASEMLVENSVYNELPENLRAYYKPAEDRLLQEKFLNLRRRLLK